MTPEEFFAPMIEQGTLDYRTMLEWAEKDYINTFFLEHFDHIPDTTVDFVKIDGKFVYKTRWEKRIPVQILNGVKVISLDNIPFTIPG